MHANPPATVVETISRELTVRTCPGCGARIDLHEYGLLTCTAWIVCRACKRPFQLSNLIRV